MKLAKSLPAIGVTVAVTGLVCLLFSIVQSTDALRDCIDAGRAVCGSSDAWSIADKVGFILFCLGLIITLVGFIKKQPSKPAKRP
jgi:hypothetical protein